MNLKVIGAEYMGGLGEREKKERCCNSNLKNKILIKFVWVFSKNTLIYNNVIYNIACVNVCLYISYKV